MRERARSHRAGLPAPRRSVPFPSQILIQSVCETMVPKLVAEDIPLLFSLLSDVFPGVQYHRGEMTALREELRKVCQEMYLTYGDGEEVGGMWVEKVTALVLLGAVPTDPLAAVTTAAGHREEADRTVSAKAGGHIAALSRFVPKSFPQLKCRAKLARKITYVV